MASCEELDFCMTLRSYQLVGRRTGVKVRGRRGPMREPSPVSTQLSMNSRGCRGGGGEGRGGGRCSRPL